MVKSVLQSKTMGKFEAQSLMGSMVGLAEKHSLVGPRGAAAGPIPKRRFPLSPCQLAVLIHVVQSPRARSEAQRVRTRVAQHFVSLGVRKAQAI